MVKLWYCVSKKQCITRTLHFSETISMFSVSKHMPVVTKLTLLERIFLENGIFCSQYVNQAMGWTPSERWFDLQQRQEISLLKIVQSGSGAHPASNSMHNGGSFTRVKAVTVCSFPLYLHTRSRTTLPSTRSPFVPWLSQSAQSGMRTSFGRWVQFTESHTLLVIFFFTFYLFIYT